MDRLARNSDFDNCLAHRTLPLLGTQRTNRQGSTTPEKSAGGVSDYLVYQEQRKLDDSRG